MSKNKILVAFVLNLCFSVFEFVGGVFCGSVAILSDSIHDLGDAFSIGISYLLEKKSEQKPDDKYTYGYNRFSSLGAFFVNAILFLGSIGVVLASVKRFFNPVPVKSSWMIAFAVVGFIINLIAMIVTSKGESLNQKAVNLHMLEDVLGWFVVLVGAIIMKFTSFYYLDAILSIITSGYILLHSINGLKTIAHLFLLKVPDGIKIDKVKRKIEKIKNVQNVHHLHIWSIDGNNHLATMHIVCDKNISETKKSIKELLKEMNIVHSTIEIESKNENCDDTECTGIANNHKHNHCHHHHH
jgi:cobalt-zinc-cadmium efflux system protein